MFFKFTTAGESHGKALVAIVEGVPAGLAIDIEQINHELWRRQQGYGRGGRMKIERDTVDVLSGIRHGKTIGSPIALSIENKDFVHWQDVMSVSPTGRNATVMERADSEPGRNATVMERVDSEAGGNATVMKRVDSEAGRNATVTERASLQKKTRQVTRPRPGHADLAGGQKFQTRDLRDILERASARETAARVACGAIAKQLLAAFGIEIRSHVVQLGGIPETPLQKSWEEIAAIEAQAPPRPRNAATPPQTRRGAFSPLNCADPKAEAAMIVAIDVAKQAGDTLGGVFEVVAKGVVPGLGSHTSWNEKLDGRIAQAFMSIHAVKAVEIGTGVENASKLGSEVHDEIFWSEPPASAGGQEVGTPSTLYFKSEPPASAGGREVGTQSTLTKDDTQAAIWPPAHAGGSDKTFFRVTNRAGGLEGGITNGEELRVRGYMKPISTLRKPLRSVDIDTKETSEAAFERSDITAVPAAGVIGEAMLAIVLANSMREKFGGDSLDEMKRNFDSYRESLDNY